MKSPQIEISLNDYKYTIFPRGEHEPQHNSDSEFKITGPREYSSSEESSAGGGYSDLFNTFYATFDLSNKKIQDGQLRIKLRNQDSGEVIAYLAENYKNVEDF